ncbi:thiopurine S-methyltransferase [Primorskyibacter aestuariivivens]|uniref:thiopurine S-methyltransferase n=1 Tax=Primorskyibacter aestuariivivens TaxID=1888912 RepID=UPI0022FFE407|nr:thiopurine S-methyltransferase [Primorskyibacter aestuariivivens]MDA7428102.1 thiopurine S-methyltransferase [Primorskyibacter aestuariivivens]
MDKAFWDERWRENRIGFHKAAANPLLTGYFDRLHLSPGGRVFVPLCGKSFDLDWLLSRGHAVVGIELYEPAVAEVFDRLGLRPRIDALSGLRRYSADELVIFAGDLFHLTSELLGSVDAVYDRAALIALPPDMRARYAAHVTAICGAVPQLLITLDYDQSLTDGPPFSVPGDEVRALYGASHWTEKLHVQPITGSVAKSAKGEETLWSLKPL